MNAPYSLLAFALIGPLYAAAGSYIDLAKPPGSASDASNVRAFGNNKMGRVTLGMDFNGDGFSDLVTANSTQIFVWFGKSDFAGDKSYHSYYGLLPDVTIAGMTSTGSMETADLNGDEIQDLIVGDSTSNGPAGARAAAGEVRVIFGKTNFPATLNLAQSGDGGADLVIYGSGTNDKLTSNTESGMRGLIHSGDLNGDGRIDLILGARDGRGPANDRPYSGEIYVVYGRAQFPQTLDLSVNGNAGANLTIYAATGSSIGANDSCLLSDINADGVADIIIGSPNEGRATDSASAGRAYIIFGKKSTTTFPATLDLTVQGSGGADVTIYGADYSKFLTDDGAMAAGDVNGDGKMDLVLGSGSNGPLVTMGTAPYTYETRLRQNCGAAFLVFGRNSFPSTIDLLDETQPSSHAVIYGKDKSDKLSGGGAVSVGDLDGDGLAEIALGAPTGKGPTNSYTVSGEIYIVKGRAAFPAVMDLSLSTVTGISTLYGPSATTALPRMGMMKMADLDGDGFNDLVINASGVNPAGLPYRMTGAVAYIVNGRAALPASLDLSITGAGGSSTIILGAVNGTILNRYGFEFGDFNKDGGRDLLISSLQGTHVDVHSGTAIEGDPGETYVIYGGAPVSTEPEISLLRSDSSDVPSGTSFSFGTGNVGKANFGIKLTVRNVGTGDLNLGAINITGNHAGDFQAGLFENHLGPGLETTLTIGFTPSAIGPRNAVISIASNDANENPFVLDLDCIGNTPYDDWATAKFGISAGDINVAGFNKDPDGNGMSNGVEYVFGIERNNHPKNVIRTYLEGTWLELEFSRTFLRTDVILEVQAASDLAGPWELAARADGAYLFVAEPGFHIDQFSNEFRGVLVRDRFQTNTPGVSRRFMRVRVIQK
jgi:hypothetical protein